MEYADASSADVVLIDIRKTVEEPHRARIVRVWCSVLKRTLECTCEAHLVRDVVVDCSSQQRCERTGVLAASSSPTSMMAEPTWPTSWSFLSWGLLPMGVVR